MANEKNIRIGDVLLQAGYINQDELDEALEYQKNNKGIRLGEALIKLGFITEHQQLEALSARLGQRYVKIDRIYGTDRGGSNDTSPACKEISYACCAVPG